MQVEDTKNFKKLGPEIPEDTTVRCQQRTRNIVCVSFISVLKTGENVVIFEHKDGSRNYIWDAYPWSVRRLSAVVGNLVNENTARVYPIKDFGWYAKIS